MAQQVQKKATPKKREQEEPRPIGRDVEIARAKAAARKKKPSSS